MYLYCTTTHSVQGSVHEDDNPLAITLLTQTRIWLQDLRDGLNFGLYSPPMNGKAGKFLDEERPLRDYPLQGPIGFLEVSYWWGPHRDYPLQGHIGFLEVSYCWGPRLDCPLQGPIGFLEVSNWWGPRRDYPLQGPIGFLLVRNARPLRHAHT